MDLDPVFKIELTTLKWDNLWVPPNHQFGLALGCSFLLPVLHLKGPEQRK